MSATVELKQETLALGSAKAATGTAVPAIYSMLSRQNNNNGYLEVCGNLFIIYERPSPIN
jgi:hypothetical protein